MFNLHVVQAQFGDSMIVEYNEANSPKYILIDGGPSGVYDSFLKEAINEIVSSQIFDVAVITHIDADHISGVLDLLAELKSQQDNGETPYIQISELWLNTFKKTIDVDNNFTNRISSLFSTAAANGVQLAATSVTTNGIREGNKVITLCNILNIPMNSKGPQGLIRVGSPNDPIEYDNLTLTVVGPALENLNELQQEWDEWLTERENEMATGSFNVLSMSDKSIPNLSSIAFLIEGDGKRILFTGDGRGDHLLQGLKKKGLLTNGAIDIDVLKVAHHGSDRNTDREFFERVKATKYVISANGKYKNPDYTTLTWIVESSNEQGRQIELIITNETSSTKKLLQDYNPEVWGYKITYIEINQTFFTIK